MASESETRQETLGADFEPEARASSPAPVEPEVKGLPRLEPVNRQQMVWRTIDVERLIEEDHPARAIWELVGKMELSSFRKSIGAVEGKAGRPALDELFTQVLGLLSAEGLVMLQRVMHDGTKIKASAEAKQEARVSESDPEARVMKQGQGGFAPSYNVQISTDAEHKIIVRVGISQSSSDQGELGPAVDKVGENLGRPEQAVADGGFTSRETIVEMERRGVDFIGSMGDGAAQSAGQFERRGVDPAFRPEAFRYDPESDTYTCPAGKVLVPQGKEKRPGVIHHEYRAPAAEYAACAFKAQCCPHNAASGRMVVRAEEAPAVVAFRAKMATAAAKQIYRQRGAVAEFPNAWIKDKIGLRQFRLRGLPKVRMEALWACLTYNIKQWIRLHWKVTLQAAT